MNELNEVAWVLGMEIFLSFETRKAAMTAFVFVTATIISPAYFSMKNSTSALSPYRCVYKTLTIVD